MNIGAIAVMPEGWKLAPKDRLPKPLKKEMKGLAWAPYSKETAAFWKPVCIFPTVRILGHCEWPVAFPT